jgi:hypothetical protein
VKFSDKRHKVQLQSISEYTLWKNFGSGGKNREDLLAYSRE